MTFYESKVNAKEYVESVLNETTVTAEFYGVNDGITVEFNTRKMNIRDFLKLAAQDDSAKLIITTLQDKMKELNFKGNIIDFINTFFSTKERRLDIIVKQGAPTMIRGQFITKPIDPTFDDEEIKHGMLVHY